MFLSQNSTRSNWLKEIAPSQETAISLHEARTALCSITPHKYKGNSKRLNYLLFHAVPRFPETKLSR